MYCAAESNFNVLISPITIFERNPNNNNIGRYAKQHQCNVKHNLYTIETVVSATEWPIKDRFKGLTKMLAYC